MKYTTRRPGYVEAPQYEFPDIPFTLIRESSEDMQRERDESTSKSNDETPLSLI